MIEETHARSFAWSSRSHKLCRELLDADADLITLAECDR
jgi:hypothetical protein